MTRAAPFFVFALVALASGCPIVDDDGALPGAPCKSDRDCDKRLVCDVAAHACVPDASVAPPDPPVGCGGKGDGDACSDGDGCTVDDACSAGACVGAPKQCGGGQVCSGGACVDLGSCTLDGTVKRATTTGSAQAPSLAYDADTDQLAMVYDDTRSQLDEIYFQLLDASGALVGPAVQLTHGEAVDQNDVNHNSFDASLTYNPDQKEFAVVWTRESLLFSFDAQAMTVTSNGVPTPSHQITAGEAADNAVVAWTGATYGAAWVSGLTDSSTNENLSVVEFAPLHDDGSKVHTFSTTTISQQGARPGVALVFNPRTASFAIAYALDPGALVVTTTNVDGVAAVDTAIAGAGDPVVPSLAVIPGGVAVVWLDAPGGASTGALRFAVVSDGLVASSPVNVSDAGEACGRPSLVGTANGLAVAYSAQNAAGDFEIRLRLLDDDGAAGAARVLGAGQRAATAALPAGVAAAYVQVAGGSTTTSDVFAASSCLVP